MSEWDFQWEEVHPSERKTSQVSAEVGGGFTFQDLLPACASGPKGTQGIGQC